MRESALGDMFTFSLGGLRACLGKDLSHARPPASAPSRLGICNLITAIVIDLGEIRDINCDNLCILTQRRCGKEGRKEHEVEEEAFCESLEAACDGRLATLMGPS